MMKKLPIIICALLLPIWAANAAQPSAATATDSHRTLPVFVHFFDWFNEEPWQEDQFVDPFDWPRLGTALSERGTERFYASQFDYIAGLGITDIAWEFNAKKDGGKSTPPDHAIAALKKTGLHIAPVYDLEITLQVYSGSKDLRPELVTPGQITDKPETTRMICRDLAEFYAHVPKDLVARDRNGDAVIFVFGFGFDDSNPDPARWSEFAERTAQCMTPIVGPHFKFYWTATNHPFEEHLFLKHRDHFTPWQFVEDMPQSQFGHDSVTWNFGFDNLYVRRHYHLKRLIRMDPRYIEEGAWLAAAADPSLVFIYGWNEPFESSFLFPSKRWGEAKGRLAAHYIATVKSGTVPPLPKVLLIVDDFDQLYGPRKGDWHLQLLREMLLYRLRLLAPQADLATADEVTPDRLRQYQGVIDLTSVKSPRLVSMIEAEAGRLRLMLFDPLAATEEAGYRRRFFASLQRRELNRELPIAGNPGTVFARDDIMAGEPCPTCSVLLWADAGRERLPLVIADKNAVLVNSYGNSDEVMAAAFQAFYGRPMGRSILYGEGLATQAVEVTAEGAVVEHRLSRHSVNQGLPIPDCIDWFRPPPELDAKWTRAVFGLDAMPVTIPDPFPTACESATPPPPR